jgi:DNA-binding GntR family transcriptional regulator
MLTGVPKNVSPGPDSTSSRVVPLLAENAYERVRKAIVTGELRPNQRLVEAELAEWLDLSRTPLREGLAQLASEGLVARNRRSWIVREQTRQEVQEIHEVRAALEGMAVYLAAERGSDEQIQRIAHIHSISTGAARDVMVAPPQPNFVEYNDAFHDAIVDAAGNERLRAFLRQNREFFFTHRIARMYDEDQARAALEGHDEIVAALRERDGERSERAMRRHILEARDVIIDKLY